MKHRGHMSESERAARSRSAQAVREADIIAGSLVTMKRTCGKQGCRCARGHKHESQYLALNVDGRRKMVCIPDELLPRVEAAVGAHKQLKRRLQVISKECFERLVARHKE